MAASTPEFSPDELAELLTAHMPDIPGFQVSKRLGRGGMSYVYLGVQESLNRQVAIKIISPVALKDEISKVRFEREARTIAKLQHPVIVDIYEVGRTELGLLYYVMPYLPRGNLAQRDLRGDEPAILGVLRALLWALEYAHDHGVVHRDVKPENVLFDNVDRPRLTDFGIAVYRSDGRRLTNGGFALGSASHMAPEQARGEKVDGRADLYSVGVLTYELLTGDLPYHAEDPLSLAVRHAVDPVPRLPAGKAHWQAFIDRALAKTPEGRFSSAREMMTALDAIERERLAPPKAAASTSLRAATARSFATSPEFLAIGAMAVLLLAVLVGFLAWSSREPSPATRTTAEAPARLAPVADSELSGAAAPDALVSVVSDRQAVPVEATIEATEAVETVDPTLPADEQARRRAATQIERRRLTQPAGDNALESLLRAHQLAPASPQLASLAEAWLVAMQPFLRDTFAGADEQPDLRQFAAARQLADALDLRKAAAWLGIERLAADWLRTRLQAALAAGDLPRLRAVRASAEALGIAGATLEPEWSRGVVTAQPGDAAPGAGALTLLRLPDAERPGLAAMPRLVSRADYARFAKASASGRDATRCKLRTKTFTLRARRWDNPGFDQQGEQPVVCISLPDALAYAAWLGERDGQVYRLASIAEWRAHFAATSTSRCAGGRKDCTSQVREWSAACGPGCKAQPALGLSWRDSGAAKAGPEATVDPAFGYDDIGFRLVREVSRAELEQR
jgi:hypothetical protein